MRWDSKLLSLPKHNYVFVKFAFSFLVLGLAFRLLSSDSIWLFSNKETPPLAEEKTESPVDSLPNVPIQAPFSSPFPQNGSYTSENGKEVFHLFNIYVFVYVKTCLND